MDNQNSYAIESIKNKKKISLDLRFVVLILLLVIAGMCVGWKPWSPSAKASDQTVSVTGEATVKDKPDEYTFSPSYQFTAVDKNTALTELKTKSTELIAGLKKLGVADSKIKSNSNGYEMSVLPGASAEKKSTYSLQMTIKIGDKELAQKVEDYLVTTTPTSGVSPQATFSESKKTSLENKARSSATKDARAKADQMAKNLGFKIGKVKSVEDGQQFNASPMTGATTVAIDSRSPDSQLAVQPGEDDLNYSVTVVYYIR